jgi:MFS family permease
LAFVSYIGFLLSVNPVSCAVFIAMMGLGCSGLYASILSYGSQQAAPSPRLTTFLVSIGCAGGVLSYLLSSLMNQLFGLTVAMAFGAVLLGVVFMLIFFADRMRDEKLPGTADKSMTKGC